MGKIKNNLRLIVQACWTALTNGYVYGYLEGKIYTGQAKNICVPGLNCYSCPGAFGACPIGSLQAVLDSSSFKVSCYVLGFLMMFGSIFGRFICGWLCPFGLVQDLVYKIPLFKNKKRKSLPGHKYLIYLKYVILILFVIILPSVVVDVTGSGSPWFCEYICPSGTLMGGIPLVITNPGFRAALGGKFAWKVALLCVFLACDLIVYRPFCKYMCPLGAIYGLFNPISLYRFEIDRKACVQCGKCKQVCKMDIDVCENPNSRECIRCGECKKACPKGAIKCHSFKQTVLLEEQVESEK